MDGKFREDGGWMTNNGRLTQSNGTDMLTNTPGLHLVRLPAVEPANEGDTIPLIEHQAIVDELNQRLQERTEGMLNRLQEKTQREGFIPLEDHLKATTWQPIETAPKDGTWIILAGPSGYVTTPLRCEVAHWYPEYHPRNPWQTHSNDPFSDGGEEPTHWMPLPEPPTPTSN